MFDLTDKIAVITGAGRGIGLAMAQSFAEAGAKVAVVSRTESNAAKAAEAINAKHPGAARAATKYLRFAKVVRYQLSAVSTKLFCKMQRSHG